MTPTEFAGLEPGAGLLRWDRMTVRVAWVILLAFTALSSYLNARFAAFDAASTADQVRAHASIPIIMLAAAAFTEMAALSRLHRVAKALVVTVMGAVFAITLIASYVVVLTVARTWNPHAPVWVNAALAAVPDLVMVMAGVTILNLRMRRHGLASAESRTPQLSRLQRLADAATARAEAALAVPKSSATASLADRGEVAADVSVDPLPATDGPFAEYAAKGPRSPRRIAAKPSADPASLEQFMETANRLAEDGLVRGKTPIDYARILLAVSQGWSKTRIKNEFRYSHGTTQAVIDAAAESVSEQQGMATVR